MIPLYRRLLGARFDELPGQVRELHDVSSAVTWAGSADVTRGSSLPARAIATLFGLPPDGRDQPLTVMFAPRGDTEIWTRTFGKKRFISTQRAARGELRETVGPCTLQMILQANDQGLALTLGRARIFGMPVPRFLLPHIRTAESELDGRYMFDVETVIPAFGLLVRYRGWLERAAS